MSRADIKIKRCSWFKDKKCSSPEIDRFRTPGIEEDIAKGLLVGDACPYPPEASAFISPGKLRCPEFRHEH